MITIDNTIIIIQTIEQRKKKRSQLINSRFDMK